VELQVGPFDPELHVRSRDHYEAVRREIRLLQLQPGEPPVRLEDLAERLAAQFPGSAVDAVAERAYLAGAPTFVARASIPDHLVTVLPEELDDWAHDKQANLLEAPEDVKRYRAAYLGQAREQFQAALG